MSIEPISALQTLSQRLYPSLPKSYSQCHTFEEFEQFLEQYLVLSGDLIDRFQATPQGERHGFSNTTTFAYDDGIWCCDIPTIFADEGCEEYLKLCLTCILVLSSYADSQFMDRFRKH